MVAGLTTGIAALLVVGTIVATIAAVQFKTLAEEQRQTAERERDAKQKAEEAGAAAAAARKKCREPANCGGSGERAVAGRIEWEPLSAGSGGPDFGQAWPPLGGTGSASIG